MFTLVVALLGLNKESMERTNKFSDYKKNHHPMNIRGMSISPEARTKTNEFDTQRVISTDFDEWLSITTKIDADTTSDKQNYFKESFEKEKAKGILTENNEIWNKIVCEILRNSLAHGNIKSYRDTNTLKSMIELTDIDQKKGGVRTIKMPLNIFEELLNSDSFTPKYCMKKNEDLKRVLKLE